jgi:hypothetical protein
MKRDDNPNLGNCRDFECPTLIFFFVECEVVVWYMVFINMAKVGNVKLSFMIWQELDLIIKSKKRLKCMILMFKCK